ncbi:MAG: hypothetical protein FJ279_14800 [Planctomycetes bacterium]|nr:hypothetical protein [Planctomycetota bacterium]MBM4080037.1 hypothetical protein [Planctomycetota bacterium]
MERRNGRLLASVGLAAVLVVTLGFSAPSYAEKWTPVQLSVFNPVQAVPDDWCIYGLRLNVLYGENDTVAGLDLGIGANQTTRRTSGVQAALVGNLAERMDGVQAAVLFSGADIARGVQIGAVTISSETKGLQLGLFNFTTKAKGVQIGLINWIEEGWLPFCPLINWNF